MFVQSFLLLCVAAAAHGFSQGPADIVFHLFTRQNPTQSQPLLPNANIIASSMFNRHIPTIFTIHSYNESVSGNFNAFVVKAHLDAEDVNVIAVDWSRGSYLYTFGLGNAPQTGDVIARFINILNSEFEYGPENIRIVGVGLGGHIAGIAARRVNGDVPHIVALDPSFIGWTHHPDKLKDSDAGVVEVLYVTAGRYGYDRPLGDLNFYPNGGSQQTGCGTDIDCSHIYGYAFYAESLTATAEQNHFVGTRCENIDEAVNMQCSGPRDVSFGGTGVKRGFSGIYTFVTNPIPPFARG